ncbi:hypothetical protein BV25DRAFT_1490016 [Artomyces pyxidatus]|uniref:Uncharacterized protein n=1 Tax=Artomyces pyxidatus TaxID=48021 RepID=A0ACB8TC33_9AGAM|nr:hypothetical protein BV25DRAFT_1490016 [Artomyces pyxidatus]
MAARVFALIIGIDQYKSGQIWNLTSCVDDALNVKRWLMDDLHVPRDQICVLLDEKASKRAIEDKFISHLVSNSAIESGDAMIVYFAGHGSSQSAPDGWCNNNSLHVEMICPYDHTTRVKEGRVAGITDWSIHAMLAELSEAKGDNITLILDCCFSPTRTRLNARSRRSTRWTPTTKLDGDDLYAGLWRGALSRKIPCDGRGFYQKTTRSHVTILACNPGERAMEEKDGGRLTVALLAAKDVVPLHRTSYGQLMRDLSIQCEGQHPVCVGQHRDRVVFGGAPFIPDGQYVSTMRQEKHLRIEAGAIHGIVEGSEFSLHEHNVRGSLNPILATLQVFEVHPTWSLARPRNQLARANDAGWARITRWNNRKPFHVHLKKTCSSFIQWWRLRQMLPPRMQEGATTGGFKIVRVEKASEADISVKTWDHRLSIERHDTLITKNCPPIVYVPTIDSAADASAIDAAARFHLHLHRKNSLFPLRDQISMDLCRLDEESWRMVGPNLLEKGQATLSHEDGTLYAVSLENKSELDLWPYLFWMDSTGYVISSVYQPAPNASAPLPAKSKFMIGTGDVGSEALSFRLNDSEATNSGFLKLFLSTSYAPMNIVEQGPLTVATPVREAIAPIPEDTPLPSPTSPTSRELWDSMIACITIVRKAREEVNP